MSRAVFGVLAAALLAGALTVAPSPARAVGSSGARAAGGSPAAAAGVSASATASDTSPTAFAVARLEDDDLRLRFGGTWSAGWLSYLSGQTFRASRTPNAYCAASFEGTGCALVSRLGPDRGRARVYLDGVAVQTLDLYSATATGPRSVWATDTLAAGPHAFKVVVLGTKSSASKSPWVVVDAIDVSGNTGSAAFPGTVVNNGNSKLLRRGTWSISTRGGAAGGSAWRTSRQGATATIRFKGTAIAWIGRKDPNSGRARIYLDGKSMGVVSQYSSEATERRVAWSRTGLKYGVHTVTVKCLSSASDSAGGEQVDVDAFAIRGTLLKAYPPTPFSYPWSTYIVIDKSDFKLYWVKNGLLLKAYPIAHGKPSTPTPSRVWRIDMKYYTDASSVYGPRKMRLFRRVTTASGYKYEYTAYAIHGTDQPWVIGTMASHGCIRMYNSQVLDLFPQVPLHTMVVTRQ